jgi:hypothetical protein
VFNTDFNGGVGTSGVNQAYAVNGSVTNNLFDQTALIVQDVGGGGTGNSNNGAFNNYNILQWTVERSINDR